MRHRGTVGTLGLVAALLLTACGGAGEDRSAPGTTLTTPLAADPPALDPDTYYQPDGLLIMTSTYEGLLRYGSGSTELEGLLATDWEVSPDGLTYTFTLRDGVTFSDGTPFDAEAAKASFQRRIDMQGGPSYMLAEVVDMQAADPLTFVVTLARPVAPFLHYLASPYGPLMTSPTAVQENEVDGDRAAGWLADHTAGTGPYVLTEVTPSTQYRMEVNPGYWGEAPAVEEIVMPVVSDFTIQRLQLEQGDLDMVLHGLSREDYAALAETDGLEVRQEQALLKAQVWVNPDSAVFGPVEARAALRDALDPAELTEQVFGAQGAPSTDFYPVGMLPDGAVPDVRDDDGAAALQELGGGPAPVVIGFQGGDSTLRDLANRLQVTLQQAAIDATVQDMPSAQVFNLPADPAQRPDLFVTVFNPDAAHPDTWSRIYQYANAPVNLLGCTVPEADALLDQGLVEPDPERSQELYVQAATAYRDSLCWINLADVNDTIATRAGYTGWSHQPAWMWDTGFATLEPAG
ncbi:ABC transporter substrate-binding protein [Blastococcus sp. SYSU D00669]